MSNTAAEFDVIIAKCSDLFLKKMKDYGTAWRILRTTSLTDQIFIKAQRIRTLEQKGESKSWRRNCTRIHWYNQLLRNGDHST